MQELLQVEFDLIICRDPKSPPLNTAKEAVTETNLKTTYSCGGLQRPFGKSRVGGK